LTRSTVRRTALILSVMVLALAGCGSDESTVEEVPGAPVELTVPHQKGAADLSEDATGTATPTPTPSADGDATPAPTADSGTTGSTGATGTNTGAAATPAPATQDSPTTDTAPRAGSAPEKFEQFCQENAGAC
jgi:hypothetical protein